MKVGLLGPVTVMVADRPVLVRRRQERELVAILALAAGTFVPIDRLAALLWADDPPAQARLGVQAMVSHLRAALRRAGAGEDHLVSRTGAYALRVAAEDVDLLRFRGLLARARGEGDPVERVRHLTEALALWRGVPLADTVDDAQRHRLCPDAGELEPAAWEELLGARLDLGEHRAVVADLRELSARHPLRERPVQLLMLALSRGGRNADALQTYATYAEHLADQTGLDPGPDLRELRTLVLRGDAPAPVGPGDARPAQLPAPPGVFVGRAPDAATLDVLLDPRSAYRVGVISGPAGVGKSALALHWAHGVRDRFPDGQLFVDLQGYSPLAPLRPIEALAQLLVALGLPAAQIPVNVATAAATYRSLVADRRLLVVLDNAAGADQIRLLLPGGTAARTVVTSRDGLAGLAATRDAQRVALGRLTGPQAVTLLRRLGGYDEAAPEPPGLAALALACDHLPLALRILAARLRDDPAHDHLAVLSQLRADRLAVLRLGDDPEAAVSAAYDLSYRRLPDPARRLFRGLGLLPGVSLAVPAVAELAATHQAQARHDLGRLHDAHLVELRGDRPTMHDLLRLYAAEQGVAEDSDPARAASLDRVYRWYLAGVSGAAKVLYPMVFRVGHDVAPVEVGDRDEAMDWLATEREAMIRLVVLGARQGPYRLAAELADQLRGYLWIRSHPVDWLTVGQAALDAAARAGQPALRAAGHLSLGQMHLLAADPARARAHLRRALRLFRRAGDVAGSAATVNALGALHSSQGEVARAAQYLEHAISIARTQVGSQTLPASLSNLAVLYAMTGQLRRAQTYNREALDLFTASGSAPNAAITLANLGKVSTFLGEDEAAERYLTEGLALSRRIGMGNAQTLALIGLAGLWCDTGRADEAGVHVRAAVDLARDVGVPATLASALNVAGRRYLRLGDPGAARVEYDRAVELARESGAADVEVEALTGLSLALTDLGRDGAGPAGEALVIAERLGHELRTIDLLLALAASGTDPDTVSGLAREALRRSVRAEYAPGRATADRILRAAVAATG